MLLVREANRNDVDAILNLWEEFTAYLQRMEPDFFQLQPNARQIYQRTLKKMLKFPEYHIFVADEGEGILVGYHVVSVRYPGEIFVQEPYGHVSDLYLRSDYRGQAVGKELLEAGVKWLKGQGVRKIDVKTYMENIGGTKFWRKNGFEPFEVAFKSTVRKNLNE